MSASTAISDIERYDAIVYLYAEAPERDRVGEPWLQHLPEYDGGDYNEALITATFCEMYEYYRSMGLPKSSTAHMLGISDKLLDNLFLGKGVSMDSLVNLLRMELHARASFRKGHLEVINNASIKEKKWKAALAVLELVCPEEFARRDTSDDAPPLSILSYDDQGYEDVELPDAPD